VNTHLSEEGEELGQLKHGVAVAKVVMTWDRERFVTSCFGLH
jgi:hypothetical protein